MNIVATKRYQYVPFRIVEKEEPRGNEWLNPNEANFLRQEITRLKEEIVVLKASNKKYKVRWHELIADKKLLKGRLKKEKVSKKLFAEYGDNFADLYFKEHEMLVSLKTQYEALKRSQEPKATKIIAPTPEPATIRVDKEGWLI